MRQSPPEPRFKKKNNKNKEGPEVCTPAPRRREAYTYLCLRSSEVTSTGPPVTGEGMEEKPSKRLQSDASYYSKRAARRKSRFLSENLFEKAGRVFVEERRYRTPSRSRKWTWPDLPLLPFMGGELLRVFVIARRWL